MRFPPNCAVRGAIFAEAMTPAHGLESMTKLQEPDCHVSSQLSDLSCTIQSLQNQSQAARAQVELASLTKYEQTVITAQRLLIYFLD